ncbi:MAG: hypothetical protein U0869_16410 [Chloroflexota bacterium]
MRAATRPRTALAVLGLIGALLAGTEGVSVAGDGQAVLDGTAGDVIAAADITPWFGGTLSGTGPDGRVYTLEVPPWSLGGTTHITMRPVTGTTDLGPIVAGAAFEPAGTILGIPATLTITGVTPPDTAMAFDFRGSAGGATADASLPASGRDDTITMRVRHFSGNVAVDLGKNADQLWDQWIAIQSDTTPEGRVGAAETRYAAADAAQKAGRIGSETAASIKQRAVDEWTAAEHDRLLNDPKLTALTQGGKVQDFYRLQDEIARILALKDAAEGDGTVKLDLVDVFTLSADYFNSLVTNLEQSPGWQKAASSGLVSDLDTMTEAMQIALGLARQLELLGSQGTEAVGVIGQMAGKWRTAYLDQCSKGTPVDVPTVLGIERQLQLLGVGAGQDVGRCVVKQIPTPAPQRRVEPIIGRLQWSFATDFDYGQEVVTATIDAVIVPSPETGQLVFGRGSRMDISQVSPEPPCNKAVKGCEQDPVCPALVRGAKQTGLTIGSAGANGVDPASVPAPDVMGEVQIVNNGALLLRLAVPSVGEGLCHWGGIPIMCPQEQGALLGKLERTKPSEWNFSCSVPGDGYFISAGGRLVGG